MLAISFAVLLESDVLDPNANHVRIRSHDVFHNQNMDSFIHDC